MLTQVLVHLSWLLISQDAADEALSLSRRGRDREAIQFLEKEIGRLSEASSPTIGLRSAPLHLQLGVLYNNLDRMDLAERHLLHAIKGFAGPPENTPMLARALSVNGSILVAVGRLGEANDALRRASELQRRLSPAGSADLAASLLTTSALRRLSGDPRGGLKLLKESRRMLKQHPSKDLPVMIELLIVTGGEFANHHRFDLAEPILQEVLERLPPNNNGFVRLRVMTLRQLGGLYLHLGRAGDAVASLLEATHLARQMVGIDKPVWDDSEAVLARAYMELGMFAKAESLLFRFLEAQQKLAPGGSVPTVFAYGNLADVYERWNRPSNADRSHRETIARAESFYGTAHYETADALDRYASFLKRQRRAEAREVSGRAKLIREGLAGSIDPRRN